MFDQNKDNADNAKRRSNRKMKRNKKIAVKISKKNQIKEKKKIKAQTILNVCHQFILNGNYNAAIKNLTCFIFLNQYFPEKQFFVGAGNKQNWDGLCTDRGPQWYKQASQQNILSKNPYDMLSVCFAIQFQLRKAKSQQIISWYKRALQMKHDCFQLIMGIGNAYYNCDQFVQAQKNYLKAQTFERDCQKNYQYLAWIYNQKFKYQNKAQSYVDKLFMKNNNSFYGCLIKGIMNDDIQQLKRSVEIKPEYYRAYVHLACLEQQKQKYLQICKKFNQNYPLLILCQARFQKQQQNYEKVFKLYERLLAIDPSQSNTYFQMGDAFEQLGIYVKASLCYEKGFMINPNDIDICRGLGLVYCKMNIFTKATDYLTKCTELNPYDFTAYKYLGKIYQLYTFMKGIKQYLKIAKNINPQFYFPYLILATCEIIDQNFEQAIWNYKKVIELNPQDKLIGNLFYSLSSCYWKLKNYETTMQMGLKCIEKDYNEGMPIFELLGEANAEMLYYKQSLTLFIKGGKRNKQFKTDYIIQCIHKYNWNTSQACVVLNQMLAEVVLQDSLFEYFQITSILFTLQNYNQAYLAFQKINQLYNRNPSNIDEFIVNQLQIYNGSNEEWKNKKTIGFGCDKDLIYIMKQMHNYNQAFRKMFGLKIEKQM